MSAKKVLIGVAEALGVFLIIPCLLNAWTYSQLSIKEWPSGKVDVGPYRPFVDEWQWSFLNRWYGNSEDGVSGQQAYIWVDGKLTRYVDTFPSWTPKWAIAFAWSVWRNGANNIKRSERGDSVGVPL